MTNAPLIEHHVLDYPGGYTRSVGTAVSRYLTGLRDGRIIGIKICDGRVMVPTKTPFTHSMRPASLRKFSVIASGGRSPSRQRFARS